MASPGNQHCVSCIGTLSFPIGGIYCCCAVIGLSVKDSSVSTIYEVDGMEISDAPRYEHRGVMLDVARNFHTTTEILKLIDVLAMYKLSKLHLHLADDEGWRLQIPGLEELTEVTLLLFSPTVFVGID